MSTELKQKYLLANSPKPPNFEKERTKQFEQLLILISTTERTKWLSTGFNCGPLIEGYKQVYGLTSEQFQTLLMLLINIFFKDEGLSTDVRAYVLKLLNSMTNYQIKITDNFKISNERLLIYLKQLAKEGMDGTLKNSDAVIEELSKFILFFSRFGSQVVEEALEMAVECNDIRYLVIFMRSIKSESVALRLLTELFSDNNLWDRDCSWFFILGEIIKKFPKLDYSSYYQTIMQEVIRAFTTIINGDNEDSLKKLITSDAYLQIQPVLKSSALIMAFLMLPASQPQHVFIKSCIQRLFSLIVSSLDYINPPEYLSDLMSFAKTFVRNYLLRFRGERGLFMLYNEDIVEDHHEPKDSSGFMIDEEAQCFFDSLWVDVIPKIVFLQDAQECKPSKIIAELCMYKPQKFLELSMKSVLNVVNRDDPTLVSFHGAKITILFLQEYIILDQPLFLPVYADCFSKMLGHLQRLGVPENLDIIELFFRTFLYLSEEQLNEFYVQSLVNESITMLLDILEPMSIGLEGSEADQAQLYLDLANIFMPFFLRLDESQIKLFSQRFIYKLVNQVPEYQKAYEMIAIALTFIDDTFPIKVVKHIKKELLTFEAMNNQAKQNEWEFLEPVEGSLYVRNEQVLKWYTTLLQRIFQYHPHNVVKYWKDIETIIVLLIKEWENQTYLEIALDILYNSIWCLCKPHLPWKQFSKKQNGNYRTLNIQWQQLTPQVKDLIDKIFNKFFVQIKKYLQHFYTKEITNNNSNSNVLGDFDNYEEQIQNSDIVRIRKRNLKLVEYVVIPELDKPEDAYDKKIIYSALYVQFTVMSALMFRAPFHSTLENIGDFLTQDKYYNLRPETCKYLQWVLQLLGHFSLMADQQCVKLFNYFWRESHDEVSWTAALQATTEKISPYYYPQLYKKKELLRSPFLIVNEAYLIHMARMEFHLIVAPTAHLNNPRYLESNFILGISPTYEPSLHSYFPCYVEVHQYHRQLIAICRYHLNPINPNGYLFKYLKEEDQATKERFSNAIRYLIISMKRLLNVFSDSCCMKDQFVRNTIFEIISLYKLLPKKNEKSLIHQLIYVLLVFSFDPLCLEQASEYPLKTFWSHKLANNPEAIDFEVARVAKTVDIKNVLQGIQKQEQNILNCIDLNRGLKLTRSCSFEHDTDIQKQLSRAISYLLSKIEQSIPNLEKDFGVYLLMLLLYSNSLNLSDPLISKIIILLSKLCQSESIEVFEMSKTGFFHIINRFNYNQRHTISERNTAVKRPWEQFLRFKYIGGDQTNYENMKIQKNQYNFYPNKNLMLRQYRILGTNPSAQTYSNQLTLLSVLEDEKGMLKFLNNCSLDPELKQLDQSGGDSLTISQENFKSIAAGAHKLMHFIWDSNPTKTPLFMGLVQRYSASPLNFYNRIFRKVIRISNDKTKQICFNLAQKLRESDEPQMIRLSFYISCELMLTNPKDLLHTSFIDYLQECTKQNFDYVLMGFYGVFTSNFVSAEKCYDIVLSKLRSLKGAPRLRHLELSNIYMIAQGRFARKAAIDMSSLIMKGIEEGGDQISEAIVNMITECFVQAINLKMLSEWVEQPLQELIQKEKMYLLNDYVGYNHEFFLIDLLNELLKKAKEEEELVESSKLRIYSQIIRRILASIIIYRFNSYFYKLLKETIVYVMERPQLTNDDSADFFVITQLCDSEYPEDIYKDLLEKILLMADRTPYVVKKKLMFLQGIVINRSFRLNKVEVPLLLSLNEKQLTLDYIITVASIYRIMKNGELTDEAENILKIAQPRKKHQTYTLMAILMATGSKQFEWKEKILSQLIKHKKDKLVKEGISEWWKGKTPQTDQQNRISAMVKNFENPYSYFA